ncbi:hypothetical protein [Nostoc sp.]|uniref:hypothetical protein n=1 Tax=Nostoc sp. TaxID=1180 RepID=UPI003FA52FCA
MPPTDLIFDDGEPFESNRHRIAMNVLILSLQQAWADRNDFFAEGNMFIYYNSTQVRNPTAVATFYVGMIQTRLILTDSY